MNALDNSFASSFLNNPAYERNQEATLYVGNIDVKVTEEILWELFI